MDELISRIASAVGVSEDVAGQAVKIILNFLNSDGPKEQVARLMAALPGAEGLLDEAGSSGGGLLGSLGGMMGGGMGAMAALNKLTNVGLDMGQVQGVTRELVSFAREKAGPELVDEVVDAIPGLGQIL
ncbi:DUF2267 domain-containing protein [Stappia indica]|uniref:DUF2267 domain-containing protein n=1 Tax=Stappia indica TaxID=538381 RepID=UPI001CD67AB5|nr:DUF2267 domain-containing protein [Stappia indica]MCA1298405.1 DUF2267 domain-containing protein [Stappia indica]